MTKAKIVNKNCSFIRTGGLGVWDCRKRTKRRSWWCRSCKKVFA